MNKERKLRQWARAAGWDVTGCMTLAELVKVMMAQHASERSYADLQASAGLPESQPAPAPWSGEVEEKITRVLGVGRYGPGCEVVGHVRCGPGFDRPDECVSYCPRCTLVRRMREEFGHGSE